MNNFNINNIYQSLEKAELDTVAGIRIVFLAGDENLAFYAAEIGPHKKVGAHYHLAGLEIYQILEGTGEIHIGNPIGENKVNWTISKKVKAGDCFTVQEKEVHQLINNQDEKLLILFVCPKSHLAENRIIVEDFKQ